MSISTCKPDNKFETLRFSVIEWYWGFNLIGDHFQGKCSEFTSRNRKFLSCDWVSINTSKTINFSSFHFRIEKHEGSLHEKLIFSLIYTDSEVCNDPRHRVLSTNEFSSTIITRLGRFVFRLSWQQILKTPLK